ncbi:hypothetical protein CDAR_264951 [Caerostris darwini]|uniref:Uncharacterized protein n=1 Tax=Caerostris darwini TaxID=1538125 RepID=A0AAV4W3Y5_9ARAC|nr:hypothetical protein CDAR_264951 [Caerostris darwini]
MSHFPFRYWSQSILRTGRKIRLRRCPGLVIRARDEMMSRWVICYLTRQFPHTLYGVLNIKIPHLNQTNRLNPSQRNRNPPPCLARNLNNAGIQPVSEKTQIYLPCYSQLSPKSFSEPNLINSRCPASKSTHFKEYRQLKRGLLCLLLVSGVRQGYLVSVKGRFGFLCWLSAGKLRCYFCCGKSSNMEGDQKKLRTSFFCF